MDGEPAISGVDPEELIPKAIGGKQKALRQLLLCEELKGVLDNVSAKTSLDFNVDSEAVRDYVFERVRLKIRKLKNPHNLPWCECLAGWCKRVAERRALNLIRHRDVEERYWTSVEHEHTINIRGRQRNAALYSASMSQEDEIEQKERAALLVKMRRTAREVFRSLEPEDAKLISMWSDGKKLREISAETGKAISTVSNKQKEILKAFVEEIEEVVVKEICKTKAEEERIRHLLGNLKECSDGFRQLIGKSLR